MTKSRFFGALCVVAFAAMASLALAGEPSVSVERVQQRYPWNAKTDIAFPLTESANIVRLVFTLTDPSTSESWTKTINRPEAPTLFTDGQHVYTWDLKDLPKQLLIPNAEVSVSIFRLAN